MGTRFRGRSAALALSPFSAQNLSAVTKLRSALPPDVVGELEELRRHVAVLEPVRDYEAPLLGELLRAGHLPLRRLRLQGFLVLRLSRLQAGKEGFPEGGSLPLIESVEGFEQPEHVPPEDWIDEERDGNGEMLRLRACVSERGAKSFELTSLFGPIETDGSGRGVIDAGIPPSGIDFYASRLLGLGTDVTVESPLELIEAMREKAQAVTRLYSQDANPKADTSAKN